MVRNLGLFLVWSCVDVDVWGGGIGCSFCIGLLVMLVSFTQQLRGCSVVILTTTSLQVFPTEAQEPVKVKVLECGVPLAVGAGFLCGGSAWGECGGGCGCGSSLGCVVKNTSIVGPHIVTVVVTLRVFVWCSPFSRMAE